MTSDFCVRPAREVYRRPFRVGRRLMTEKLAERKFIRSVASTLLVLEDLLCTCHQPAHSSF